LRIQGNGSISASFRHLPVGIRGLYFGDEFEVSGAHDEFLTNHIQPVHQGTFKSKAIQTPLPASSAQKSLYQTFIEPDLHETSTKFDDSN
jgi:hypothetical protein